MTAVVALALLTVLSQVLIPLVHGRTEDLLTMASVVLFAATSVAHAGRTRGAAAAGWVLGLGVGVGLTVEAVGVHTGFPFGTYSYSGTLGWELLGVPLVVPLAWVMMAYPALLVGRRLATPPLAVACVGGWALASWDVFLDPQMVDAGHWSWSSTTLAFQGVPATNFAGWLVVSVLLVLALELVLPHRRADDRVPSALYLWVYASSVLANLAFFHRPLVAAAGGVAMGAVALPFSRAGRR